MNHQEFKDALNKLGVNQRAFAKHVNVSFSIVNRWATGKVPVPISIELLINSWRENEELKMNAQRFSSRGEEDGQGP
jgi:predicted transcriptional regulator